MKTAGLVVAHANRRRRRGRRRPSEGYKHERNPARALRLAQAEMAGRSIFSGTIAYSKPGETREHQYQRFATEMRPGSMQDTLWAPDGSSASSIVIKKVIWDTRGVWYPVFFVYDYLDPSKTIPGRGCQVNRVAIKKFGKALRVAEKHFAAALKSGKWVEVKKIRKPEDIEREKLLSRQPIENEWVSYSGHEGEYELQRDDDDTYWTRAVKGWLSNGWWPEWNINDGRQRWREVLIGSNGRATVDPPITGEVVNKKPMVLRLIDLFAEKAILITDKNSVRKASSGICMTVHVAPPWQKEHFDIELKDGSRYGFVPDTVDATSAEGSIGLANGRRRFELVEKLPCQ